MTEKELAQSFRNIGNKLNKNGYDLSAQPFLEEAYRLDTPKPREWWIAIDKKSGAIFDSAIPYPINAGIVHVREVASHDSD